MVEWHRSQLSHVVHGKDWGGGQNWGGGVRMGEGVVIEWGGVELGRGGGRMWGSIGEGGGGRMGGYMYLCILVM